MVPRSLVVAFAGMIACGRSGFDLITPVTDTSDASMPTDANPVDVPMPVQCIASDPCNGIDDNCNTIVDEDGCPPSCTGMALGLRGFVMCGAGQSNASARSTCSSLGGALAQIDDAGENAWLRARADDLGIQFVWIGAHDDVVEGTWRWESGAQFWQGDENGVPTGLYVNWASNAPDNSGNKEHCALLWTDAKWQDYSCTDLNAFVCEIP